MSKVLIDRSVLEQALKALEKADRINGYRNNWAEVRSLIAALKRSDIGIPTSVPTGWKLVPVEPTPEMKSAGAFAAARANAVSYRPVCVYIPVDAMALMSYRAMLAAAPQQPLCEPLTDERIIDMWCKEPSVRQYVEAYFLGAKAAERAHNIVG